MVAALLAFHRQQWKTKARHDWLTHREVQPRARSKYNYTSLNLTTECTTSHFLETVQRMFRFSRRRTFTETGLVQGRFSIVKKVKKCSKTFLEKVLECSQRCVVAERDILLKCAESENIVKMIGDIHVTAEDFTLTFEYCEMGNLDQYVSKRLTEKWPLDEADCRSVMSDIASGLQFLHNIDIIHGNIQPENILVTWYYEPRYKIGGFGSAARRLTQEHVREDGQQHGGQFGERDGQRDGEHGGERDGEHGGDDGTRHTMFSPPEEALDEKSDIFSLGVLTYALLSPQFVDGKLAAYYGGRRLAEMAGEIDLRHITDQELRDIINEALKGDIVGRPTAEEVWKRLNADYLNAFRKRQTNGNAESMLICLFFCFWGLSHFLDHK